MKKTVLFLMLCISLGANAQLFVRDADEPKVLIGLYPNLLFGEFLTNEIENERTRYLSIELRPYVSYNLYKNVFIGGCFSYEYFYSTFHEKDSFIELGAFLRYVVPYTIDKRFLRRINVYAEAGYYKTNYRFVSEIINMHEYSFNDIDIIIEEDFIISNRLNQTKFSFPLGLYLNISNNLYLDLNWQYVFFKNGKNINGFMLGVGYKIRN